MVEDFQRVLARVQSDYGFYVACQTDPDATLAGYSLTAEERAAVTDPVKLEEALRKGFVSLRPITITIKGKHDWVNRVKMAAGSAGHAELVAAAAGIRSATQPVERRAAAFRLMELMG